MNNVFKQAQVKVFFLKTVVSSTSESGGHFYQLTTYVFFHVITKPNCLPEKNLPLMRQFLDLVNIRILD
jgi:hypothetical protein